MERFIARAAPLVVLAGAAALLVSLFFRWYEVRHGGPTYTAWEAFRKADILLAIAAGAGALSIVPVPPSLPGDAFSPAERSCSRRWRRSSFVATHAAQSDRVRGAVVRGLRLRALRAGFRESVKARP